MFDLYALCDDFPGRMDARDKRDPYLKVEAIEAGSQRRSFEGRQIAVISSHTSSFTSSRPCCSANRPHFAKEYPDHREVSETLVPVLDSVDGNPELIDEGPETAPSKRILGAIACYDKVFKGAAIAEKIGIDAIRGKCPSFQCVADTY